MIKKLTEILQPFILPPSIRRRLIGIQVSFLSVPMSFSVFRQAPFSPAVYLAPPIRRRFLSPSFIVTPSIRRRLFGCAFYSPATYSAPPIRCRLIDAF